MKIELIKISLKDTKEIWEMQVKAFKELLNKYQDFETNPANETISSIEMKIKQDFTFIYMKNQAIVLLERHKLLMINLP